MAKGSRIARSEGPSHKMVEASVTALIGLFGVVVIFGSVKAGINWGAEGPRAGFFPFYIGLFILLSTAINLWNLFREEKDGLFAEWGQLRQVLSVVIPTAIYVAAIPFIGLYVASALLHRLLHALARQIQLADHRGDRDRHATRHLHRLREMVPGSASQGTARRLAWSVAASNGIGFGD